MVTSREGVTMSDEPLSSLESHFGDLPDPRVVGRITMLRTLSINNRSAPHIRVAPYFI
jgi:hypothetical protein